MPVILIYCRLFNRAYTFLPINSPAIAKELILISGAGETLKFTGESGFG